MRSCRTTTAAILVALALFALSPALAQEKNIVVNGPDGAPLAGDNWLLLIAINNYAEAPALKGPVPGAKQLKEELLSRYYFKPDQVVELYDEDATKDAILSQLRSLAGMLGTTDSLLIYYAGHGKAIPEVKKGYWIPYDGSGDFSVAENWIPNSMIQKIIGSMRCKHVLLLCNSCFNKGLLEPADYAGKPDYEALAMGNSRQAIISGAVERITGQSAFINALVRSLDIHSQAFLAPRELMPSIKENVIGQRPMLGALRDTGHQPHGGYIFYLKPTRTIIRTAKVGSLYIRCSIDGAEVWVDDNRIGTTRRQHMLKVGNLPVGKHKIMASCVGFKNWTGSAEVTENGWTRIYIRMKEGKSSPLGFGNTAVNAFGVNSDAAKAAKTPTTNEAIALVDKLDTDDFIEVSEAMDALTQLGSLAYKPLLNALGSHSANLRKNAIAALGALRADVARRPISQALLNDKDPDVRRAAANALAMIRDPKAVDVLIKAVTDHNEDVQMEVLQALETLTDNTDLMQDAGDDPKTIQKLWADWWMKNKKSVLGSTF